MIPLQLPAPVVQTWDARSLAESLRSAVLPETPSGRPKVWGSSVSSQLNKRALQAAKDEQMRELLIQDQENTILRTASKACGRYVTKSDDEWSVALCAFSKAIDVYAAEKGEFLPFAQMLIKRDLIDFHRSQKAALHEVPVAPHILEGNGEPEEDTQGVYLAVVETSKEAADSSLKEAISAANEMLQQYGFRFFDLTACSPRQEKTRQECAAAIRYMLAHPELCEELRKKRKLPVRSLASGSGVSRKTIDRYRKYLIMAVLILEGDYPQIAEYLKYVREEAPV
jgi:RNA polymerase sigma factor